MSFLQRATGNYNIKDFYSFDLAKKMRKSVLSREIRSKDFDDLVHDPELKMGEDAETHAER